MPTLWWEWIFLLPIVAPRQPTFLRKRILPAHAGKAGEVAVRGAEGEAVLDSEGGQMRVGDEIRFCGLGLQKRSEHFTVAFCWMGNPDGRAVQPLFHLPPGPGNAGRASEDTRIGNETDKSQQAGSRHAH